jgi:hypothetical protein
MAEATTTDANSNSNSNSNSSRSVDEIASYLSKKIPAEAWEEGWPDMTTN